MSPENKSFAAALPELTDYAIAQFKPEDEFLASIRRRAKEAGLPPIHVGPMDGLHLEVLARACGARKIVEIGTLAGYSAVCLARALPTGGILHSFEYDKRHAAVAEETIKLAGLSDCVRIHVGPALDMLHTIEAQGPFDLVFIDADKKSYPGYFKWSTEHLRQGGVLLGDNTFAWGMIHNPDLADSEYERGNVTALREFNRMVATSPHFRSTILPTGEGLTFAVKI